MPLLISAHGARVLLETAVTAVGEHLRDTLPYGMVMEVPVLGTEVDVSYQVCADEGGSAYRILRNGAVVDRASSIGGLCRRLRNHVEFDIAVRARTGLFVHAGVVAWRGRAILIPGSSNAGKSTLVAELVRRGATYYSDEYAVIDEDGKVHAYVRRPRRARRLHGAVEKPPVEAALLVATHYMPGVNWAPVVLEGARAVLPLLDHVLAMRDTPRRALRLSTCLGRRLLALQGPRPEAEEVAPAVLEFMDAILDGMDPRPTTRAARLSAVVSRLPASGYRRQAGISRVVEDPAWVPVAFDSRRRTVRFRQLERPFYIGHAAAAKRPGEVELPLEEVQAATPASEPAKVLYLYHHGYAGSTLLFRLLDAPGACLAYDEPSIHFHHYRNATLRRLCYRTFREGEVPLLKAVPAEIVNAEWHFADHPEARGLFVYAPVEEYVAATLYYAYRREYVAKMARFLGCSPCASAGEAAVRCWQLIAARAIALSSRHPLKTVDVNAFFSEPPARLEEIWRWLGFPNRRDWSEELASTGVIHAKTGRPFTPAERLAQKRIYLEHSRPWLEEHRAMVDAVREKVEGHLKLSPPPETKR